MHFHSIFNLTIKIVRDIMLIDIIENFGAPASFSDTFCKGQSHGCSSGSVSKLASV